MGSGLSMTSVNKIKELAEEKEYSLALDIIDSIDLTRSLNPQFLRTCGEVYMRCGRYKEARYALLLAHKIAPEAKRVMFSLISLYLERGYKSLAETYYSIYMFDADNSDIETKKLRYIYDKSKGMDYTIIDDYLVGDFEHTLDLDWSFEVILLLYMNGETDRAKALSVEYIAAFEDNNNSEIVEKMMNGEINPRDYFYIYPSNEVEDNDPNQEEERELEKTLLEADMLRINPKEAEIMRIEDDLEQFDKKSKFFKKKDKKNNSDDSGDENGDGSSDGNSEETAEENSEDSQSETKDDGKKDNLLKKVFSKRKKNKNSEEDQEESKKQEVQNDEDSEQQPVDDTETYVEVNPIKEEKTKEFSVNDIEDMLESIKDNKNDPVATVDGGDDFDSDFDDEDESTERTETTETTETNESVSSIADVEFEPEDDFVVDSEEEYESEPKYEPEEEYESEPDYEPEEEYESEPEYELEEEYNSESEYEAEEESNYEPDYNQYESDSSVEDDFIGSVEDDYVKSNDYFTNDSVETNPETTVKFDFDLDLESVNEKKELKFNFVDELDDVSDDSHDDVDISIDLDSIISDAGEEANESYESSEEEYEEESYESYETTEEEYEEETYESDEEEYEEETYESTEEEYEEETYESDEEEYEEETYESNEEEYEEETYESDEELVDDEAEIEAEYIAENEADYDKNEEEHEDSQVTSTYSGWDKVTRRKLDYPVFKSSLFPDIETDIPTSNNNFNQIMNDAQEKLDESNQKEAQMLKEAEELLASLGITLDTGVSSSSSAGSTSGIQTETIRPSRDELKASLEIDSTKIDILKQLKEYN